MFPYDASDNLKEILKKLYRKDKLTFERVTKKMQEVASSGDIEHYKNLQHDLSDLKRVQIGHFVLTFRFDKKNKIIYFDDFQHHDIIYGN